MNSRGAARLVITVREDGAMSVEGPISEQAWCLAVLENAKDAVRNHHSLRAVVVPSADVTVPALRIA